MKNKKFTKTLCLVVLLATVCVVRATDSRKKADLIAYSYNRPLQLYALLESVFLHMSDLGEVVVIYRSDKLFDEGYALVEREFPAVQFVKQGATPKVDFKPLTLDALTSTPHEYVLFAVDDIVVKDSIAVSDCINALEQTDAYGFYLRLGKNLHQCYTVKCTQKVPPLMHVRDDICAWRFASGQYDWRYPHTVDMTIYRKRDVLNDFKVMRYSSPNKLESFWAGRVGHIIQRVGLCFEQTKVVNLPLNRVQTDYHNRHMGLYSADELLAMFYDGYKMDIIPLIRIDNPSAHMEYEPTFIARNEQKGAATLQKDAVPCFTS